MNAPVTFPAVGTKLCRDCQHVTYRDGLSGPIAFCKSPHRPCSINLVTGETVPTFETCHALRSDLPNVCGRYGLWFEAASEQQRLSATVEDSDHSASPLDGDKPGELRP